MTENKSNIGYYENLCISILEEIFPVKFVKYKPSWLKNKYGTQLELDGYNDKYKLAIEFNGPYHYDQKYYKTEQEFLTRLETDDTKISKCKENGINLIVVPYIVGNTYLRDYIISRLYDFGYNKYIRLPFDYMYRDKILEVKLNNRNIVKKGR